MSAHPQSETLLNVPVRGAPRPGFQANPQELPKHIGGSTRFTRWQEQEPGAADGERL
jgi:hypothetical protein